MKEAIRRLHYFTASFVMILGLTLAYEVFSEDDPMDKLDDIAMPLLGIGSVIWYKNRRYFH